MPQQQIDFSRKNVLLVENSGSARNTTQGMLRELGVIHIKSVRPSEEVLELLKEQHFDLVILAYQSSDSYHGLQLMEQARFEGLMKLASCWVFVTSDSAQDVVLHAIDSEPDLLILRPFKIEVLTQRLTDAMLRKQLMAPISKAMDRGNYQRAIELCDEAPLEADLYEHLQLAKGRSLLALQRPADAFQVLYKSYREVGGRSASLYLAEALIGMGKLDEARKILHQLIDRHALLIYGYDLLAKIYQLQGDLESALKVLKQATRRSPLGLPRNLKMGRVAVQTGHLDVADSAFRQSIKLGEHSCYRSPEPYVRLANVRRMEMLNAEEQDLKGLERQLSELLDDAESEFPDDEMLKVQAALLKSQMCRDLHETEQARNFFKQAENLVETHHLEVDLDRALLDLMGDTAPILEEKVHSPTGKEQNPQMSAKVTLQGVKQYLSGQNAKAIKYFLLAVEFDRNSCKPLVNLAQIYVEAIRRDPDRQENSRKMAERYLHLAERLARESAEVRRLHQLKALLEVPLEQLPDGSLFNLLR